MTGGTPPSLPELIGIRGGVADARAAKSWSGRKSQKFASHPLAEHLADAEAVIDHVVQQHQIGDPLE